MHASGRTTLAVVAFLLTILPAAAAAQVDENRAGRWYIGGGLGGFSEEDNPQLADQNPEFAAFFSGGYRVSPHIALEATALGYTQDFATPALLPLPGAEARTDLNTSGIGGLVKFILPFEHVDLSAGVGLGIFNTNLHVEGSIAQVDEDDIDLGLLAAVGVDVFVLKNIAVGLEYRWLKLNANFEPIVGGELEMGGQFFFATFRGYF